jgi:hypothetical protein
MDGGMEPITDADERRAVRRQALGISVKSAALTFLVAAVLALLG